MDPGSISATYKNFSEEFDCDDLNLIIILKYFEIKCFFLIGVRSPYLFFRRDAYDCSYSLVNIRKDIKESYNNKLYKHKW